jgi:hypothetical protein
MLQMLQANITAGLASFPADRQGTQGQGADERNGFLYINLI